MNYQLLLECYAEGAELTLQEVELLEIELYSQIQSIKVSSTQGCMEVAPNHISKKALVCEGSLWITCLAAVLDQLSSAGLGQKSRGATVFDELVKNGFLD